MEKTWQEMTKQELDKQYSPSNWCIRMDTSLVVQNHINLLQQKTDDCKTAMQHQSQDKKHYEFDINYWDRYQNAKLDIYYPANFTKDSHIMIYIHGGYWMAMSKENAGFFADFVIKMDAAYIAVDYDLCPQVNLTTIVEQIRHSIGWTRNRFPKNPIIISGHSAGAHLCAMALCTHDWSPYFLLQECPVSKAYLISGIYDLLPIEKSCINQEGVHLTKKEALQNSPILKVANIPNSVQITFIVGRHDSPEFKRQNHMMYEQLSKQNLGSKHVNYMVIENVDHFNIVEDIGREHYPLTELMNQDFGHV